MKSNFKIAIPKPCHEDWNAMTPAEKGKFCSSCSKTVVDFTKQSTKEIQEYLLENRNKKVCGHFYKKQLDTIVIEIPLHTFQRQLSFQKLFILALFFAMGTTLFSCKYTDGKKQKIENVIIKDSLKIIEEEIGLIIPTENKLDSIKNCQQDSIIKVDEIVGELPIVTVEGDINFAEIEKEESTFGFIIIEEAPRFKESKNLSKENVKKDFEKRMQKFVQNNFDTSLTENLGLSKGKYRIFTQFTIDENGKSIDIKVRAPHSKIEKEIVKMFKKLPVFIPAKQDGKTVKMKNSLPISFFVE